ncbi:MAG: chitooligosaccharide deacetylase [Paenibacillaceae bacterium]|nr:chitooligosaccharide deacetylase [Paenibacillaceae bacterium]
MKNRKYYESTGDVIWDVRTEDKVIALTFDDGPHPEDTPEILDLLKQYNAHATFFIVGNKGERFPELVKREAEEGHELANHTFSHPFFSNRTSKEAILREVGKTQDIIYGITGIRPTLFRPPGGIFTDTLIQAVKQSGCSVVLWSWHQDTEDWKSPGVRKITNTVLSNARNGDIVLFHDWVEKKSNTVDALKVILPELQQRGFSFVTVSDLIGHGTDSSRKVEKGN